MKGAALASFLIVVMVLAVFSAPALAQVRGGVGFHGGGGHFGGYYGGHFRGYYGVGFYGGFYGGPWWPLWWPYYAAPVYYGYYGAYDPYYAYPPDPPSTAVAPQRAPATQCYAPRVDQSGKVVPMPDYSKPVPCSSTQ